MKKVEIIKSKQTDQILDEIKILDMINDPLVMNFEGFTHDERDIYLALDKVNGVGLFSYLRGIARLPVEKAM